MPQIVYSTRAYLLPLKQVTLIQACHEKYLLIIDPVPICLDFLGQFILADNSSGNLGC